MIDISPTFFLKNERQRRVNHQNASIHSVYFKLCFLTKAITTISNFFGTNPHEQVCFLFMIPNSIFFVFSWLWFIYCSKFTVKSRAHSLASVSLVLLSHKNPPTHSLLASYSKLIDSHGCLQGEPGFFLSTKAKFCSSVFASKRAI